MPEPTGAEPPLSVRMADAIRLRIESGELRPGDPLPTLRELAETWGCSINTARTATTLLRSQGLISSQRGLSARVRRPPVRMIRDSGSYEQQKQLARAPEHERRAAAAREIETGLQIAEVDFRPPRFDVISAGGLAPELAVSSDTPLLRRSYEWADPRTGGLVKQTVSYIPHALITERAELLDPAREPWPGGTFHQLALVGIEVGEVRERITASPASTAERHAWRIEEGVAMLRVRRVLFDQDGRPVELADSNYPADRTEIRWSGQLPPWD